MQHEILNTGNDSVPLFEMLKKGTTDLHRKMQAVMPLLDNRPSLSQYKNFLFRQLGFFIPVEEHIAEFISHGKDFFDFEFRRKVPLLIGDLRSLGVSTEDIQEVAVCGALKEISSAADLVGVLYVLEGQTLDSQVIYKNLREHLPLADNQMQFYRGYGRETYEMWYKFRAMAENLIEPAEKEQVVTRARVTMIKLKNWLRMNEVQT